MTQHRGRMKMGGFILKTTDVVAFHPRLAWASVVCRHWIWDARNLLFHSEEEYPHRPVLGWGKEGFLLKLYELRGLIHFQHLKFTLPLVKGLLADFAVPTDVLNGSATLVCFS